MIYIAGYTIYINFEMLDSEINVVWSFGSNSYLL